MSEIVVRRAEKADTNTVAVLVHALLAELAGENAPSFETIRQSTELVMSESSVIALIAFSADNPVGVMMLNECAAIYAGGRFAEITELFVIPEIRSQGVAPKLIDAALAEAGKLGWRRLEVGAPSQPEWERTLEFYLGNGFVEVGPRLRKLI